MKKIYLFPKANNAGDVLKQLDLKAFERWVEFLEALPKTKRGAKAYHLYKYNIAVGFVRREDATAFRLKFGL